MLKRVLHLRSSAGIFGAENVILEMSKHSRTFGYQSIIGCVHDTQDGLPEFFHRAVESNIDTVAFGGKRKLDFGRVRKVKQFIAANDIDILHCHGYKEDMHAVFANAGIPLIATNHLWKKMYWRMKIYCFIDAIMLRLFNMVVGVSDEIILEMKRYKIHRTVKIANGIDTEKFRPIPKKDSNLRKYGLPGNDSLILGMVSSLTPEKGHHVAIDAFSEILAVNPGIKLLIVGEGFYEPEVRAHVRQLGLDQNVVFAGKQECIPEVLSAIDIFLLPSLNEGLPMALLEAMAAGKAVIATDVGENATVINHGRTGIIIRPSNPSELQSALLELLKNPEKTAQLGKAARKAVVDGYTSQRMTQHYCALYDRFVGA